MNTRMHNEQLKERISAFIDDEYGNQGTDLLLCVLCDEENKNNWGIYQQIGDILNSDDLSIILSAGFTARLNAQLAIEPTYINPKRKVLNRFNHKIVYVAAAMIILVVISVPKFAGNEGAEVNAPYFTGQFAAASAIQSKSSLVELSPSQSQNQNTNQTTRSQPEPRPRMLRDPLIDTYLAAHQRYAKSMYSTVEYETDSINQEVEK